MTSCCLIILTLIFPLFYIIAQASTFGQQLSLMELVASKNNETEHQEHANTCFHRTAENEVTTNLRSGKGQSFSHGRHHARTAHGILNIIGWGILLPIGVIIARYLRRFPIEYDEWHPLHMLCQISGYILGTVGWGIGLWLGNSSKHYTLKTHRILGILVFAFATIQILTSFLQPRRENECSKWWEIFHQSMGYTVVALSIANIFQGIIHQSHAEKWKWLYVAILALLAFLAAALEIFRWIVKSKLQLPIAFHNNNIYNFT
ncbi:cytochrome b561 and DOMON domain-containing protein [Citrus sinensis]|uniref:Cytochrome b561 and DOMON domain-containing protein n=2 Tax=Citrus sinensis TaxID=2711 RepID=A0ACB8NJB6_CITSI|nr:cytochrome b561 and DOMON domain-containing protein At4g17280-like [Citrus sinensis]KAH9749621.1 cytochrome b561 and DOMON domain-containing protein [Citrus sinensis]KAH9797963.1 cytochrome b561 and DOMON domain-containing protein [Citrus sinensis]